MIKLSEWLKSITYTKEDLLKNKSDIKDYNPFIINKCLAAYSDCILIVNEMNLYPELDNDMQYNFLINIIRKKKRYSPWVNKESINDLDNVKKYYKYSTEKAIQALEVLSKEELQTIRRKLDTGGMK